MNGDLKHGVLVISGPHVTSPNMGSKVFDAAVVCVILFVITYNKFYISFLLEKVDS